MSICSAPLLPHKLSRLTFVFEKQQEKNTHSRASLPANCCCDMFHALCTDYRRPNLGLSKVPRHTQGRNKKELFLVRKAWSRSLRVATSRFWIL